MVNVSPDSLGVPTSETVVDQSDPLQLLSVEDVCRLLQVSRWQVYQLINSRQLAAVQIRRRRLFRRTDVQAFIDRLTSTAPSSLKEMS